MKAVIFRNKSTQRKRLLQLIDYFKGRFSTTPNPKILNRTALISAITTENLQQEYIEYNDI